MADVFGITRSADDRMVAGVLGGIARRAGIGSQTLRVIYVIGSVLSAAFPGTAVYIVLWLLLPEERRFRD